MKANKFNRGFVCVLSAAVLFGCVLCGPAAADAVLETVPANCVFCVRLNNLDYTLGQLDQFLAGASPTGPVGMSMMARMHLIQMLGDPALQGVDTAGSFAIFGTAAKETAPGEPPAASSAEPNVLTAALFPVKDYQQFLSLSPNVGQADDAGVSRIPIGPMMAPAGPNAPAPPQKVLVCIKAGQFAMVGPEAKRAQLVELAKSISSGAESLAKKLDPDQTKLCAEMPVWAYADIEQVNKTFAAKIEQAFAQAEQQMKNVSGAAGQMPMGDFTQVMKVYLDTIKCFLDQAKYVSIAVKPEPAVLRIHETVAAKPDTELAGLLTADATLPKENKLVAQLQDGVAINAAAKVNKGWMEKCSKIGISFMNAAVAGDPNAAADTAKWEQLTKDSVDSMGQLLAFSMKGNPGAKPPFVLEYIIEIKDKEKFDKMTDESAQLMKAGAFSKMYKNMGMEMGFQVSRGTGEYNGVTIDSAKLGMKVADANSPEGQMISAMYGDGFDYRMAHVDSLYLMAIGGETDATIKKMIDSVKAGANKQPTAEITAAMSLLGDVKDADFVGTFNYIRLMSMATGFMPMAMPIPFDQIPTRSNIAFAGKVADGKLVADVAVPKEHIMEFVTGMQMLMQQQQQQMQQQMQQQQMEQNEPAGPEPVQ